MANLDAGRLPPHWAAPDHPTHDQQKPLNELRPPKTPDEENGPVLLGEVLRPLLQQLEALHGSLSVGRAPPEDAKGGG